MHCKWLPRTEHQPNAATTWRSPLGELTLAAQDDALCGVWFAGQRHHPNTTGWPTQPDHPVLQAAIAQLTDYLAGQRSTFDLPLAAGGTAFQQRVWQQLLHIPAGHTCSYLALSHQIGQPQAVRAVAQAVGRNPFLIVVPCHRIVGSRGNLTGYAAGLDRKAALLALERRHSPQAA